MLRAAASGLSVFPWPWPRLVAVVVRLSAECLGRLFRLPLGSHGIIAKTPVPECSYPSGIGRTLSRMDSLGQDSFILGSSD